MWQITEQAAEFAQQKGGVVTVENPVAVNNCCMKITEAPVVSLGQPKLAKGYECLNLANITAYVPAYLVDKDLTITLGRFFSRKYLVVEGWKVI